VPRSIISEEAKRQAPLLKVQKRGVCELTLRAFLCASHCSSRPNHCSEFTFLDEKKDDTDLEAKSESFARSRTWSGGRALPQILLLLLSHEILTHGLLVDGLGSAPFPIFPTAPGEKQPLDRRRFPGKKRGRPLRR